MSELTMTAAQVNALAKAMKGLPTVEGLRVSKPTNEVVAITGWRRGRRACITPDGTVYRYDIEGRRER